jgi:hypothetical protein
MGTSTSSKGPNDRSPLVPPWADLDGAGPGPNPDPHRFQAFRTSLGKFVSQGDGRHLRSALRSYARSSTGGSGVAPRRFQAMAQAGGALYSTLQQLRAHPGQAPIDLRGLAGRPVREAIDAIVNALVPNNGDADRIRAALDQSLAECLVGVAVFDANLFDAGMLIDVMLAYVARCIFEQIVLDSKDAFAKAKASGQVERAEIALWELVKVVAEQHMRPLFVGQGAPMTAEQIQRLQIEAIRAVWRDWENYES